MRQTRRMAKKGMNNNIIILRRYRRDRRRPITMHGSINKIIIKNYLLK